MVVRYLRLVGRQAFSRTFQTIDKLSIALGPLTMAGLYFLKAPIPENIDALVGTGVLVTAGVIAFLRLLSAPYFVWKSDQEAITNYKNLIKVKLSKENDPMDKHRLSLRAELGSRLANIVSLVRSFDACLGADRLNNITEKILEDIKRVESIKEEFSYNAMLRVPVSRIIFICTKIITDTTSGKDVFELQNRLREQSKITFEIIHSSNFILELINFAEFEDFLKEYGEDLTEDGESCVEPLRTALNERNISFSDIKATIQTIDYQ
ncbi:hypothetical protein [Pedomonas mirosovicensis]|uniref:hypothetical protein n=1 Tax=Pedomonas mirosovicensis TaxID=2908641 RepID=UPI002167AC21|nr:hypothetical protein [Pedomonas mirosovicensis]MCH8684014.1 hypothetical protein [Pedomonas mirosovicensis]